MGNAKREGGGHQRPNYKKNTEWVGLGLGERGSPTQRANLVKKEKGKNERIKPQFQKPKVKKKRRKRGT